MKRKLSSQISIGIVCAILGFMSVTQIRAMKKKVKTDISAKDKEEITLEIENLKKEKEELIKVNKGLSEKLNKIEEAAVSEGELEQKTKDDLDKTRVLLGEEDAQGPGIILYLNLKSPLVIGQNVNYIREYELTHIINLLNFSGAEAISINGYRITQQTGIKNASDFIWIGDESRISPSKSIQIKAIGDINKLKKGIVFPGEMEYGSLINYDYKIEEKKDLTIEKSSQVLSSEYLKKVEDEEVKQ